MAIERGGDERTVEHLFEGLLAHSADPVLLTRLDGTVLRANPAACRALQRSELEIQVLGRKGLVVPSPGLEALLAERPRRSQVAGEVLFRRPDGSTFPADFTSTVLPMASGEPITLAIFRDISAQRRLEQSLRESEERFRAAFQTLPDAVTLTEVATGRFLAVNEGAHTVTGWTEAEMVGRPVSELGLWHDEDRAAFVEKLRAGGVVREYDTRLRRKDGTVLEVALSARTLETRQGTLLLTITRDLTPRRAAERARDAFQERLRQSQKLEAVGRLAGGVAHDFNNLLTIILSCAESLLASAQVEGQGSPEELVDIQQAGERARDLTRQLLAFARKQVITPVPLALDELVGRAEKLLRRILGEDVRLEVARQPGLWTVCCDPTQLEQVILNLAVNARDAMPQGGRLTLRTRNLELPGTAAAGFPGAPPRRYVALEVEDTGCGMSAEQRERAFEPFYTTKPLGRGTGLGLATVHGIVTQSGGFLRLESEPGAGTRFELLFPAVASAAAAREADLAPAPRGGDETLLLVEDDPGVRQVVARILRRAGYRVLEAGGADQALAHAAGPGPVALVLCDVVLPERGGRQVVEALRQVRPGLKVLYLSGHDHQDIATRGLLEPGVELLPKPFTSAALLARLRALLDVH